MEALVNYYRKYETVVPNFSAVVTLGADEVAREQFTGRSADSKSKDLSMPQVLAKGAPGSAQPLTFTRDGAGTLFYTTRLRYAADVLYQQGLDSGFHIERKYEPYVENGTRPPATSYKAGDLVRVSLTFRLTKERRFVAVTDPIPAGFEAVDPGLRPREVLAVAAGSADQSRIRSAGRKIAGTLVATRRFDHWSGRRPGPLFATRLTKASTVGVIVRDTTAGTYAPQTHG